MHNEKMTESIHKRLSDNRKKSFTCNGWHFEQNTYYP
jgi:hypothetical protein